MKCVNLGLTVHYIAFSVSSSCDIDVVLARALRFYITFSDVI